MRKTFGTFIIIIIAIYSLYVELSVLYVLFGFTGMVAGFFLSPIACALVPLYLLFGGNFMPALVIYGGGILGALIHGMGEKEDA